MADISKLNLNGTTYNLKDAEARQMIENLPEPMIFKGSLGTGGTISTLPTASSEYEGFVYKVITDGTYAGQAARVGDLFICSDEPAWILIPSGDDPSGSGTVTNVATGTGLTGGPITTSGTISVDFNAVQESLVSGTNIKTINNTSILGSGDLQISAPTYTAGDGISISNDTVSNTAGMYLGTDVESATNLIDADLLGGVAANLYATKQWVQDYIASLDANNVSY